MEIMRELRLISQNPIIATAVELTLILHPDMEVDEPDFLPVSSMDCSLTMHYWQDAWKHAHVYVRKRTILALLDFVMIFFI